MADDPFSVHLQVRSYELDALGHVNQAVYHSYAEIARTELFRQAGVAMERMIEERRAAPVMLETRAVFRRELRAAQDIEVDCVVKFGSGKVFNMDSTIRLPDGTVSCEVECVLGLMDLDRRRLVADPAQVLSQYTSKPELFS
jgi:acyl-CoA thioester hydrolase